MEKKERKYDTSLGAFTIILLVMAIILFVFAFFAPTIFTRIAKDGKGFTDTGQIGDTIGGLMGPFINLSAVIVTGLAFYMQYMANKLQVHIFRDQLEETERQFKLEQANQETQNKIQQFESQFFEMIKLHKENVNELSITDFITGQPVNNRQAFASMVNQFNLLLSYAAFGNKNLSQLEFDISYEIFFWGYSEDQVNKLSAQSQAFISGEGVVPKEGHIKFDKHQGYGASLGHYYRHLFMLVKFVAYSEVITEYKAKMKYLKILRAQLSNHEQIMLFYNWLNFGYGGAWENEENRFFTEFKMIHNLWTDVLYQNQYIVDAVNGLIDRYNQNPHETPLFEFQRDDFSLKMASV